MTHDLESYFSALHSRRDTARPMKHRAVSTPEWTPAPAKCHANVNRLVSSDPRLTAVRGWIIISESESGACYYAAHSVIEEGGELIDITLADQAECDRYRFVEHIGLEDEFWAVEQICRVVWYPYPVLTLDEVGTEEPDAEYTGY